MIIGLPNLYDKFLIVRFITIAIGLALAYLFALIRKKSLLVPNNPIFLVYLLFILLCGCSIIWAQTVANQIYFDEHKREVMKTDAVFFEPFNTEAVRQKIDADYEAYLLLQKTITSFSTPFQD